MDAVSAKSSSSASNHRRSLGGCFSIFCASAILLLIVGIGLGPINQRPRPRASNLFAQQARQIGQALNSYSSDHNNVYPYGNTSTEVFQKLLDGGYVNDPSLFYLALPGKIEPARGQRLKPENVSFDVTLGMKWWHIPVSLPVVFSTGYRVTYAPGSAAIPINQPSPIYSYHAGLTERWWNSQNTPVDSSARGIAVFYAGNGSKFIAAANPDGSIPNFISQDFRPDGKVYRQLTPDLPIGQSSTKPLSIVPRPPTSTPPVSGQPWTNRLSVTLVPAGTDGVLFSIWDVRVKDFRAFVEATDYDATKGMFRKGTTPWQSHGITWDHPGIIQTEDDPVVKVSWNDANAFCRWLTQKEQSEGRLNPNQHYRLPTDAEWSAAVGLHESSVGSPGLKGLQYSKIFSWGTEWPPPSGVANYDASPDAYGTTSPVGSFAPNQYGLYDMGGNVWQWCDDLFGDQGGDNRVLRGGSWEYAGGCVPSLYYRKPCDPGMRQSGTGFRVVLVVSP